MPAFFYLASCQVYLNLNYIREIRFNTDQTVTLKLDQSQFQAIEVPATEVGELLQALGLPVPGETEKRVNSKQSTENTSQPKPTRKSRKPG